MTDIESGPLLRPLMETPLHEITRDYSLDGLVERFNGELDDATFEPDVRARLDEGLAFTLSAHEGQQNRGEHPYATHVLRVAIRIVSPEHLGARDPAILLAALLHDTVEDRPGMLVGDTANPEDSRHRTAALEVISDRFGSDVADLVSAVTNPEFDPDRDKHEQYHEHVREEMPRNPRARIIKLSDFIDNCAGLIYNESPRLQHKLAGKYQPLIPDMLRYAQDHSTPLGDEARRYIVVRLQRANLLCDTILHTAA